ncbi:Sulfhydryl oxidase [Operophtera brumata]|uniref:Sulfhydryl oxidase n=1 Tax=Operophtera brumata TaxID=104452 RepID=A0A0L7L9F1_OPEBR|nr:Sulfhydryl oxidase [Operophtera brumata]
MMVNMNLCYFVLCLAGCGAVGNSAVIAGDGDPEDQGLYSKSDSIEILTNLNYESKIYRHPYAMLVQFYNSYCGHCRAFAPKYKSLAASMIPWKNIVKLGAIDCSVEENNEICRQFNVTGYPTLRYLHENYIKANANVGDEMEQAETVDQLKAVLIYKMQSEQSKGRLPLAPSFSIASYISYRNAVNNVPTSVLYTFLIFENENSTVGSELALDINNYKGIRLKRVYETSELAEIARIQQFPGLVAVRSTLEPTSLTPKEPTAPKLLQAINTFLKYKNYRFPEKVAGILEASNSLFDADKPVLPDSDVVYYSDLEKTLHNSLHTEITKYSTLDGEPLQALLNFLDVLLISFPFRGNLKEYITGLRATILTKSSWSGSELYDTVKRLEDVYSPVYSSDSKDFIGCKGSRVDYRGYTCGLWSLFHTLTVNAARKPGIEGPKVLRAMYGYIKNFFGCTECVQHFLAMAERNRLFDVKENDKAVLWLWISHNEVNLRLAGDVTEDPQYPKIQFPSIRRCPACRLLRGAWNLPAVYQYLQGVYGTEGLRDVRRARSAAVAPSPFSDLDIGMLSLLYLLSFIILILVIKYFLTRGFYRKRLYKHGLGKV